MARISRRVADLCGWRSTSVEAVWGWAKKAGAMVVVAAVMSFFLPGMMLARALRSRERLASGVVLSLLVSFESVLLLDLAGIPITIGPLLAIQTLVTIAAALVEGRGTSRISAAGAPAGGQGTPRDSAAGAPAGGQGTPRDSAAGAPAGGPGTPRDTSSNAFRGMGTGLVLAMSTVVVSLLAMRTWLQPVSYLDVWWRWDFIARRLLSERSLSWYPPVSAVDFTRYGYADGIPPMVSLGYWVPYAALGQWVPSMSAIFIALQYAAVLWATFCLGRTLFGRPAGLLAVAVLLSSRAFFGDVAIGQDTGLTALALTTMGFYLMTADRDDPRAMAMAAACAALGALTREYSLAYIFIGAVVSRLRGQSWRGVVTFCVVACSLSAPWYLRSWAHTGNPFYDNPTAGIFPNNPVHVAMLKFYGSAWSGGWDNVALELLKTATLPLLLGLGGMLSTARRSWPLLVFCAINTALFVMSARYTASGPLWAARVLAPSWALLAVGVGALARSYGVGNGDEVWVSVGVAIPQTHGRPQRDKSRPPLDAAPLEPTSDPQNPASPQSPRGPDTALSPPRATSPLKSLLLPVALAWAAATVLPVALLWPTDPAAVPLEHWRDAAFFASAPPARRIAEMRDVIEQRIPRDGLVLSDDMNIFAAVVPDGWTVLMESNPAVRFLFDPSLSGADAGARLRAIGVRAVCVGGRNGNLNRMFLDNFPFFRDEVERWPVIYENAGARLYVAP